MLRSIIMRHTNRHLTPNFNHESDETKKSVSTAKSVGELGQYPEC